MSYKGFLIWSSGSHPVWWSGNNPYSAVFLLKESIMGNIPVKLYGIRTEMSFKDISYLELWQPFCSEDRNHLFNFDKTHHEKQFCKKFLNLDPWFKRKCRLNVVLMLSSDSPVCSAM